MYVCVCVCVCVRLREQVSSDLFFDDALKPRVPQVLLGPEEWPSAGPKAPSAPPCLSDTLPEV